MGCDSIIICVQVMYLSPPRFPEQNGEEMITPELLKKLVAVCATAEASTAKATFFFVSVWPLYV